MVPAIYNTLEREKFVNFTNAYLTLSDYYITNENYDTINDIKQLYGKEVAVIKGYSITQWLEKEHPQIKLKKFDFAIDAFRSVEIGSCIAVIQDNPSATYIMEKNFISNLKFNNVVKGRVPIPLYMGVSKDNEILVSILNKSLKSLSRDLKKEISDKWMKEIHLQNTSLDLESSEIAWLTKKPTLKFAVDPYWLPIESINPKTKSYEGMMADYLQKISDLTGIKFKLSSTDSWSDSVELVKNKKVDMLAAVSITEDRKKFLNFSRNTITLNDGIVMKSDARFISKIEDLEGFKVGVSDGTSLHNMLKNEYPKLILVPLKGTLKGISELTNGNIDAFIGNLEVISYTILKENLFDLKVVLKLEEQRKLQMAFNKNVPKEAVSIINKAIKAIDEKEMETIRQRWIGLKVTDSFDYSLIWKGGIAVLILFALIIYNNRRLKKLVDKKTADLLEQKNKLATFNKNLEAIVEDRTKELNNERNYVNSLMNSQENIVLSTDGKIIKTANKAFFDFYKIQSLDDFIKNYGNCICDTFDEDLSNEFIQKNIEGKMWTDYVVENNSVLHKAKITVNGETSIFSISIDKFIHNNEYLKVVVLSDITELEHSRRNIEMILANIMLPILITSKKSRKIIYANGFASKLYEKSESELIGSFVDDVYTLKDGPGYIIEQLNTKGKVESFETFVTTNKGKEFIALLSVTPIEYEGQSCYLGMTVDITVQKNMENEIRQIHKHTKESIEYASLIQHALIPSNDLFKKYFSDYLTIWQPKDIVGGDIYLFEELRDENECLLMVIDCTGHGVPGAFVTMLVKAIERQITARIIASDDGVSPAEILTFFNQNMKKLLKQEDENSISNAGFDGGILYYNKKEEIVKYSGAETPLFYIDENGELQTIKGSRHSVGYKKSDPDFVFKETVLKVKKGMKFYLTTDGYLDQNGGDKGFPLGKKRFTSIIDQNKNGSCDDLRDMLIDEISKYQGCEDRNDDVTVIGVKI